MTKFVFKKIEISKQKIKYQFPQITCQEFIYFLKEKNLNFLDIFFKALEDASFNFLGFFLNFPPFTRNSLSKESLEFVVIENKQLLANKHNYDKFEKIFQENSAENGVVTFSNLSKDCTLICPLPNFSLDYKNVSEFTKNAPKKQQISLWNRVGVELEKELKKSKILWLNTHGLGVSHFHIRLDTKPKYYFHDEYTIKIKNLQEETESANKHQQLSSLDDNSSTKLLTTPLVITGTVLGLVGILVFYLVSEKLN